MGRFVTFNQIGYLQALEREVSSVMSKVEKEIMDSILNNFGALNIRELDTKFVSEMRRAIRYATEKTTNSITSKFKAGYEGTPNESYRLVYYEYGTGRLMVPPTGYSPTSDGTWNPNRPKVVGEPVWTRPYGPWQDAGGNDHRSKYRGKPRMLSNKSRRAQPIKPQYWFTRGFWMGCKNLDRYVLEAVKSVPISSYISIADIYKRM